MTQQRVNELADTLDKGQLERMQATGSYPLTRLRSHLILDEAGISDAEQVEFFKYLDTE